MSSLLTGILEGGFTYSNAGTPIFSPFANRVAKVSLSYSGELVQANTFSSRGVSGPSASCLSTESATITIESEDITWAFLQGAAGTIAADNTSPTHREVTTVVGATQTTFTLPSTPAVGQPIYAALQTGEQVAVTVTGGVATFTTPADAQGRQVTFLYYEAATADSSVIAIGSGSRISEVSLYGRFRGCGDLGNLTGGNTGDLIWIAERCAIKPSLELNGEAGQKSMVGMTLDVLRDSRGDYVRLYRL